MTLLLASLLFAIDAGIVVFVRAPNWRRGLTFGLLTSALIASVLLLSIDAGWLALAWAAIAIVVLFPVVHVWSSAMPLRDLAVPRSRVLVYLTLSLATCSFAVFLGGIADELAPVVLSQFGMLLTSLVVVAATAVVGFDHERAPSLNPRAPGSEVEQLWKVWRLMIPMGVLGLLSIIGYAANSVGDPAFSAGEIILVTSISMVLVGLLAAGLVASRGNVDGVLPPHRRARVRVLIVVVCAVNIVLVWVIPPADLTGLSPITWTAVIPAAIGALLLVPQDYEGNIRINGWKRRRIDVLGAVAIGLATAAFFLTHVGVGYWRTAPNVELIYLHAVVAVLQLATLVWAAAALGLLAASNQPPRRMPSTFSQSMTTDSLMYSWLLAAGVVGISAKIALGGAQTPIANLIVVVAVAGVVLTSWRGHIKSQDLKTAGEIWHDDYMNALRWQRRWQICVTLLVAIPSAGGALLGATT